MAWSSLAVMAVSEEHKFSVMNMIYPALVYRVQLIKILPAPILQLVLIRL